MSAKIRLWLQTDGGIDDDSKTVGSVTWCSWNANNTDTEYVRADLCTPTDERVKALESENARLREALTPSGETKAAYISEVETTCPDGRPRFVDWTATKDIMKMIRARAALRDMDATP